MRYALRLILCFPLLASDSPAAGRPRLLASFFPPAVVAFNVAGTNADVEVLLDNRVDPHDFQFSRSDLAKIARADLLVLNGLGMESWLQQAFGKVGASKPTAELAAQIEANRLIPVARSEIHRHSARSDHEEGEFNPHIWLDPLMLAHGATNVLRALQQIDPDNAASYAMNTREFVEQLWKLDAELRRELAPVRQAPVVTWHDAFAYFARRYGPDVIGVVEPVAEVDPSPRYLVELSQRCRANRVRAVFDQPGVQSRLLQRLADDWGDGRPVPSATLDTLENQPLKRNAYVEAMRANARVIRATVQSWKP